MEHQRPVANPKVLLPVAGVAMVGFSAIAIYVATAGCSPDAATNTITPTTSRTTSTAPGR